MAISNAKVGGIPASGLKGKQPEVLCLPASGHTVVLGTAGSGKSTLAVHRALYLSDPGLDHEGSTLLITFNKCLVTYLRHLLQDEPHGVTIEHYHKFARGYLNSRGRMGFGCIAGPALVKSLCLNAIQHVRKKLPNRPVLERPVEFFVEEVGWIAQHGVENAEQYRDQRRIGRAATPLKRRDRDAVFEVYRKYKKLRKAAAKDYDWDDLSHAVLHELERDSDIRRYRHIVIDEGQDLSPMEIKSLCAAVPQNGSVTFFGDVAQQIYGSKMSWRHAGLQIGRRGVWKFEQNYRNTAQIAKLALAVADMPCFSTDADIVAPKSPTAHGELPTLAKFKTEREEMQFVAQLASSQSRTRSVGVLFRDRTQEREFSEIVSAPATRLHRELSNWPRSTGLFHGTYHSAKGVEFDTVILPRLSQSRLPDPTTTSAFGGDVAEAKDVSLIYVAVTRAKTSLILTYAGKLTRLLPRDKSLYNRFTK